MRILLDHNVPRPLKNNLPGHDTDTAADRGWQDLNTGELLDQAETDGYELFLTSDRRIPSQQNLTRRNISVLNLTTNSWPRLRQHLNDINEAVEAMRHNRLSQLDIPYAIPIPTNLTQRNIPTGHTALQGLNAASPEPSLRNNPPPVTLNSHALPACFY